MADGDVILQIPNAFIEINSGDNDDLAPIVDVDQTGELGSPYPPNHAHGQTVRWDIKKVLPANARVFIGPAEQAITESNPKFLEFTANTSALGIGEYDYVISENPAGEPFSVGDIEFWWAAANYGVSVANSELYKWDDSETYGAPLRQTIARNLVTGDGDIEFLTNNVYPGTGVSLEATPDTGANQYPIIAKTGAIGTGQFGFGGRRSFFMRYYRKGTYTGDANSLYKCITYASNGDEVDSPLWALIFFEADFYLTFRYFTAANAASWTDYATTIPIPADEWTTLIYQYDEVANKLWVGCNGQQQSFDFTPSDWTSATYFYIGGPWGTYLTSQAVDDGCFWDAYYSETMVVTGAMIFGDKPTYYEPTNTLIGGVWSVKSATHAGATGQCSCVGTADDAFTQPSGTNGTRESADWNGTAWTTSTSITSLLTQYSTFSQGHAGSPNDNIIYGGYLFSTASWNGTAWSSEANLSIERDDDGGDGSSDWNDGSAFVLGTHTSGQNTRVEYYNGTSWSIGASTANQSQSGVARGEYSDVGAIYLTDNASGNDGGIFDGTSWSNISSAAFPGSQGTFIGAYGRVNSFITTNNPSSVDRFLPKHWNGLVWTTMEEMFIGGNGMVGVGPGIDGEGTFPATCSVNNYGLYTMGYSPFYSRFENYQGWFL